MHRRTLPALALGLLSCLPGSAARAANVTVTVGGAGFAFTPAEVTIQPGDSVTWTNAGGAHNVRADDDSFRCANGCDGEGGDGDPATNAWSVTRTFPAAGDVGYHCEEHGAPGIGMHGTVHVEGSAGSPGRLRFSAAAYSVDESTSSVTLVAQRVNGDDGAVSVDYATANGTARSGQDYGARQGTLSWADQDGAPRSFTVPILDDDDDEGAETFQVHLTGPTGGAQVAAPGTATVTINDDDDGPGSPPPAPGNLQAAALGASAIRLTWQDTGGETGYRVERRSPPGGAFAEIGAAGADVTSFEVGALAPASFHLFRVRAENSAGLSGPSNDAGAATDAPVAPCAASATTLCLNGGRFAVEVEWRAPAGDTGDGSAVPLASIPDSGLFHFFSPSNLEMLIKVLEACALNSRYWVFYGATTNVEFVVKVSDSQSGKVRAYYNPLGRPAPPVQDTSAFATCP